MVRRDQTIGCCRKKEGGSGWEEGERWCCDRHWRISVALLSSWIERLVCVVGLPRVGECLGASKPFLIKETRKLQRRDTERKERTETEERQ